MKEKTIKKLKLLAKILYWVFIVLGCLLVSICVFKAVIAIINPNELDSSYISVLPGKGENEYLLLISGVISFAVCLLLANVCEALFNGFAISLENGNENNEANEKMLVALNTLIEKSDKAKVQVAEPVKEVAKEVKAAPIKKESESKTDLSALKKTTVKPRESVSKLEDVQKAKKPTSEDIKEKLAKAKSDVQKIMSVKSQIAANSVDGTMLDDIKDKQAIVDFETPEKYCQIESELFKGCKKLEKFVITDNIKLVGSYAFSGCKALSTVEIGEGIAVIEEGAFDGCTGLNKVIYNGSKKQWNEVVIQSGNELLKGVNIDFKK